MEFNITAKGYKVTPDFTKIAEKKVMKLEKLFNDDENVVATVSITKEKTLYKVTFDSFSIDVKLIIQELILAKAKSFYLIHNHPDEESRPSEDDIIATTVIEKASKNLSVKLINHIVIFKGGYSCVKDQ